MSSIFFILLSLLNPQTLAPHPIYFTVDGRSKSEIVSVDGKTYSVDWDGTHLSLREVPQKPGYPFHRGTIGCLFPFLVGPWLWLLILSLWFGKIRTFAEIGLCGWIIFSIWMLILFRKR